MVYCAKGRSFSIKSGSFTFWNIFSTFTASSVANAQTPGRYFRIPRYLVDSIEENFCITDIISKPANKAIYGFTFYYFKTRYSRIIAYNAISGPLFAYWNPLYNVFISSWCDHAWVMLWMLIHCSCCGIDFLGALSCPTRGVRELDWFRTEKCA